MAVGTTRQEMTGKTMGKMSRDCDDSPRILSTCRRFRETPDVNLDAESSPINASSASCREWDLDNRISVERHVRFTLEI